MTISIGQKLKQAREARHITLDKASDATRIRVPYLQAIERDDLAILPSPVQARGFLRNYAEYLGLNIDQLWEEARAAQNVESGIIGPADEIPLPSQPEPAPAPQPESQPEPDLEKTIPRGSASLTAPAPEVEKEAPAPIATDTLWQTWLNRISGILPRREKAETHPQVTEEETPTPETEPVMGQESTSEPEAASSPDDGLESTRIFREIGEELRTRRELLSLHFDEVERNTHVKTHYLQALERGTMQDLPSTVQTRGMLSNYASFLDLDVDALLLRYADALQARHREKNPQKPARKPGQPIVANLPPMRSFIAGDIIFGIGMAALLIVFSVWGINQVLKLQSEKAIQPTAPSISDVLLASPDPSLFTATPPLVPVGGIDEATATIVIPTQNLNVSVQVNLVAVERTFMRVIVDGKEAFNGRVVPGTAYPFEAEDQIQILVGSGAAIRIVYNGQDLGLLGGQGQVVDNIYRADEIITPTAQPTPTPTQTVPVTPTLPSTLTPVPSSTPSQ